MSLDLTDWQNKKYTTRDGRPVRILCVDAKRKACIIGLVLIKETDEETPVAWYQDGSYTVYSKPDDYDLINAKAKKEGWVNVWKGSEIFTGHTVFNSEEEALSIRTGCIRLACVKIEWEE